MNSKNQLRQTLWSRQQIDYPDVDYNVWEEKKKLLRQTSEITHSCLFTVDVFRNTYDFASRSFSDLFGYKTEWIKTIDKHGDFFEDMIHPDDLDKLMDMQIDHAYFIYSLEPDRRNDFSTVYTFRMRNARKKYLNVISRQKVIQQDMKGKAWIILGEVGLSPDQHPLEKIQGISIHLKTGQIIHPQTHVINTTGLSDREVEVLRLIHLGYLSKEIADKLCVSIHTVNNHRKHILHKLNSSNAIEAINAAKKQGYL